MSRPKQFEKGLRAFFRLSPGLACKKKLITANSAEDELGEGHNTAAQFHLGDTNSKFNKRRRKITGPHRQVNNIERNLRAAPFYCDIHPTSNQRRNLLRSLETSHRHKSRTVMRRGSRDNNHRMVSGRRTSHQLRPETQKLHQKHVK